MSKIESAISSLNAAQLVLRQARTGAEQALYGAGTAIAEEGHPLGAGAYADVTVDGKAKLAVTVRRESGTLAVALVAPTSVAGLLLRSIPVTAKIERAA